MNIRIVVLALLSLFVTDNLIAQQSKKTTLKSPGTLSTEYVIVDTNRYMVVGTGLNKSVVEKPVPDRAPEPLLRVDFLVEYPKSAIERQLEDTVRFFATVKNGLVTNVVLQGDADPLLMDAVREAASKLKFDLSWHDANRQEFQYTQQIIFKLPDIIIARP